MCASLGSGGQRVTTTVVSVGVNPLGMASDAVTVDACDDAVAVDVPPVPVSMAVAAAPPASVRRTQEAVLALALCHSVTPVEEDGGGRDLHAPIKGRDTAVRSVHLPR